MYRKKQNKSAEKYKINMQKKAKQKCRKIQNVLE